MQSILKNYQIIIESIQEGVFTVNKESRIMSFNRAAERITGVERKDAIGQFCHKVFRTNVCEKGCVLRQTIKDGKPCANQPVIITRRQGDQIPISVNTALLLASDGKVLGGVEIFRDMSAIDQLRKAFMKQHTFDDIVSKNDRMRRYFEILPQIAESDTTVLIDGPTGTGKELFARAIHNHSLKKSGPFVAVNCGSLPDTLIESELFGYREGAFTNAKKNKPGRFDMAHNGTIFLDEIGDVSPAVQIRLLRVLQQKEFEPLGATHPVKTNARVIAATNRDLEVLIQNGSFREDLYYRINVMKISLPPLAQRKEDLELLIDHFVRRFNLAKDRRIMGLTQEAKAAMMLYDWPGNVRQLENALDHAFVLCKGDIIGMEHLPERIHPATGIDRLEKGLTLNEIERVSILNALERNHWKKVKTADELGIDKNTLRRKLIKMGINR